MPLRIQTHTHTHLLGIDHLVTLLVNYWQTTVKTKSKEVLLLGTEKAGKNERPSAIVFHKGQMQFNPIIWRDGGGGGGGYLSNRLRFRGEEQERAIQQNSCTL